MKERSRELIEAHKLERENKKSRQNKKQKKQLTLAIDE